MRYKYLLILLAGALAAACSRPVPPVQDGSELWLAAGRPYEAVLASVQTAINPALPAEGFHIYDEGAVRRIEAGSEAGLRYGVYALQRAEVLGQAGPGIDLQEAPFYPLRLLNHWDNLDDTVERGYAGLSMWEWTAPDIPEARIRRYGELCASVGLNGAVLNNVNSNPLILDAAHIARVARIAAILREYFSPNGRLCVDTQTAYLLCLNFGVYVDKDRLIEGLKKRFQKDCYKIKGGFVGATMMCRVLAENGREELAAHFLFQEGFPG